MKEPQTKRLVCIGSVYQQPFRLRSLASFVLSKPNNTFEKETSGTEKGKNTRKSGNFRKAIYSTESCGNFWMKMKWNGNFQDKIENLSIPREVVLCFGNYVNLQCSFLCQSCTSRAKINILLQNLVTCLTINTNYGEIVNKRICSVCICLFCIGFLRNVQRFITRARAIGMIRSHGMG